MRPGDDPARRRRGRDDRPGGRRRGDDRRVHARRRGRSGDRRRGRAGRRRAPAASPHRRGAGARGGRPVRRSRPGRLLRAPSRRDPRRGGARRPGAGRPLRRALRAAVARERRGARGRPRPEGAASVRRDPRRRRPRSCRPPAGAPAAALGAREHRVAALQHGAPLGPDQHARRGTARAGGGGGAADRHARGAPGAAALGRQPAEGDDRALARQRLRDDALLRSDPRDRRRDEAADLRAAAPARGRRRGDSLLLERAGRVPTRLRPRADALRRRRHRRARRERRPTRRSLLRAMHGLAESEVA